MLLTELKPYGVEKALSYECAGMTAIRYILVSNYKRKIGKYLQPFPLRMNSQIVVQYLSFCTLRMKENKKCKIISLIAKWKKNLGLGRES